MSDPKQVLLDLEKELSGDFLEHEVEIRGKQFLFRTLSDKEMSWVFNGVELTDTSVEMGMKARIPTLAIGIRKIGDCFVEDLFGEEWGKLSASEKASLLKRNKDAKQFHAASCLKDWLGNQSTQFIQELFTSWQDLEGRQTEAQDEIKNSSGEGSTETEKTI